MLQSLICGLKEKEHLLLQSGRVRSKGSLGRQTGIQASHQAGTQVWEGAAGKAGFACTSRSLHPMWTR